MMAAKNCKSCKHWRLDRGTNRYVCICPHSDEYGDYTADFFKCRAFEAKEEERSRNE